MSDILNSVALSYHHDVLGVLQAQDRLRSFDREGAYLLRESDVRPGFFVLSLFKDSSMLHLAVPDKNGKFLRQTLEEACKVVEDIVNSCDGYIHPVPAHSIASNLNDNESGGVQDGTKCYYCSFTSEVKRILESHMKQHKIVKCEKCFHYVKKGSFSNHKKHCNRIPEELKCLKAVFLLSYIFE